MTQVLVQFQQHFHDAIRDELVHLSSRVLTLEDNSAECDHSSNIEAIRDRYDFLHCAYKYHSEAEDEVVFRALDSKVKNVSHAYHLEHEAEEKLFEKLKRIFANAVTEGGNVTSDILQDLICTAEAVHTTLESHLTKEEAQVFPLLAKHFDSAEQASLVWQFLCSIPVDTVQKLVEWVTASVPIRAREELVDHLKGALPADSQHGHLLSMWLPTITPASPAASAGMPSPAGPAPSEALGGAVIDMEVLGPPACADQSRPPIQEIKDMHNSIRNSLQELIDEARKLSDCEQADSPDPDRRRALLSILADKLMFLRAMTIYHSSAEDGVIFPAVQMRAGAQAQAAEDVCHGEETELFEQLGQLIHDISSTVRGGASSVELTTQLVELALHTQSTLAEHLRREEEDVLPLLEEHFTTEEQRSLVWGMLRAMPLRLLERVLPWVAQELSEEESNDMQRNMQLAAAAPAGGVALDAALAQLLTRWAQRGRYNAEVNAVGSGIEGLIDGAGGGQNKRPWPGQDGAHAAGGDGTGLRRASSYNELASSPHPHPHPHPHPLPHGHAEHGQFLSQKRSKLHPNYNPIDHVFQFHKALNAELVRLEEAAANLITSSTREAVRQFQGRYHLMWGMYRAHSNAEDDIVFPALEAKEALHNVSYSYTLDHKQEEELLNQIGRVVIKLMGEGTSERERANLAKQLRRMCTSLRVALAAHVEREELELWPLLLEHFTVVEQDELVSRIIGCTGADVLKEMLPWVTSSLTVKEQQDMLQSLGKLTRHTMFDSWLDNWWRERQGDGTGSPPPLGEGAAAGGGASTSAGSSPGDGGGGAAGAGGRGEVLEAVAPYIAQERPPKVGGQGAPGTLGGADADWKPGWEDIFRMNQKQLEAAVRKVSSDPNLEPHRKAYIIQNLMTSRWIVTQQAQQRAAAAEEAAAAAAGAAAPGGGGPGGAAAAAAAGAAAAGAAAAGPGLAPSCRNSGPCISYHDESKGVMGCEHYQRKALLVAQCCGRATTCRFCHDREADHNMDRFQCKEMVCMKCGLWQAVGKNCSGCGEEMARYFCSICKLFDDTPGRDIYHCPFCNLCRRGKGLGIDFFHCMTCNACMSMDLKDHRCLEKGLESNCPICREDMFTSPTPVRALACGHLMHSHCFQSYTKSHYTCPMCTKSLGDMTVYFGMLDALLSAEELPEECATRKQRIMCNDCGRKGDAKFHFVYHKCGSCGSYNTRLQ